MNGADSEAPDWSRVKEIFAEASDLPAGGRAAHVHRAAAGDRAVEAEVLRLLRLDQGAEEWLDGLRPPTEIVHSAAELHAFFPGQVLAARYEIQQFLAVGGMGEVYRAHDLQLDQNIAIKVLSGELATADQLSLLKREVQAARRIQHANVCRVFDLVHTEMARGRSAAFLTMELLQGETLSQKLRREGAFTERQALPLIRQMVAALAAAHQAGVVHGDFKSANVMIVPREGGSPRAVVTDFGLARRLASGRGQTLLSASQSILAGYGTPAYMSPEQIQGGKASQPADIYALGVVLYEMLTGELPYGEDSPFAMAVKKTREPPVSPESLSPALRRTWSAAILRCMQAEPGRRFADVRDVLTHLETRTRRGLWWKLVRRKHRRLLRIAGAAAGVAAVLVLARWLWPAEPGAQAVVDWQEGVYDLQAGEPVAAARRLERALAQHRLPPVAHAYLAWAWHDLGFADKADAELSAARRNRKRIACLNRLPRPNCMDSRSRPARFWRAEGCWPTWPSSTIDSGVLVRRRNGSRWPHSLPIIRQRICAWPNRPPNKANGSRRSGSSFWRRLTSRRSATATWSARCPPAAASRAWRAETPAWPVPTCPRSSACSRVCPAPATDPARGPSR